MAGLLTYIVKTILKIILYFLRSYYKRPSRKANLKRSGSVGQQRTSSPVEEHPRRDVNFTCEVSSVPSQISNGTNVQDGDWETFAEYDVPGEEQTLNLEEQNQLLERLREENRRLHMKVMKKNKDDVDYMSGVVSRSMDVLSSKMTRRRTSQSVEDVFTTTDKDEREDRNVDFGSQLLHPADVLPLKLNKRRRGMFLSVDDVSTVCATDVRVDKDVVSKLVKCRSVDALPHMFTTFTRRMFLGVSDASGSTDPDGRGGADAQQILQTEASGQPSDQGMAEDTQHISAGVGKRNQTQAKNIGDMMRMIKRQREENSHLKMYINSFMSKILSKEPLLLAR